MDTLWTLPELVSEVAKRIAALPAPRNGQVRAIPDERTVRYYVTLGLLDRPSAMRGRTALYGPRHVAQVVAIKRLQTMGRSLSEIQGVWPTLDDHTLSRMSGVTLPATRPAPRAGFWKREPRSSEAEAPPAGAADAAPASAENAAPADPSSTRAASAGPASTRAASASPASASADELRVPPAALELRIELAPDVVLSLSVVESVVMSPADVRALRAAAAPLLAELASRRLASHPGGEEP